MKNIITLAVLLSLTVACRPKEQPAAPTATTATAASSTAAASATTPSTEPNLLSFASGALIVKAPENQGWFDGRMGPYNMLNDDPEDSWMSPQDSKKPEQVMVLAVPAPTQFTRFEFDTEPARADAVQRVRVEISDTSADEGYQPIADARLEKSKNAQAVPVTSINKGRWVRFTFSDSASGAQLALGGIRGFGTQDPIASLPDMSGTYQFEGLNPWHLAAEGSSITGCYEGNYNALVSGGVDGQTIKLRWTQNNNQSGSMLVNFAPGGEAGVFIYRDSYDPRKPIGPDVKYGKRVSKDVGSCPHWSPKGESYDQQLAAELEKKGRAIVYGINFDTDSDVIRSDSKATLDKIAALLKAKGDWKLAIEGHTDSTSTPEHNQQLSERRAASVKQYLVTAGIDGERLTTSGHGAGNPVAPNDTPSGRAQNRRVELVKS